ncbi:MAG TPA: FtsX-like permease family protein, partial [Gemmatimonadaceae bacterium]|nr:FtsX-like permease family protein [Gemmatimonadaceae bacterium]
EMAVRLSLGASRLQLLAQLLTESVLLALLGGAVSLLVARWTLAGIGSILPADAGQTLRLELEPSVVVFAAVLSLGTGLLFGMFPALHSTRPDLISTIRANAGQPSGARAAARFRTSLVTAQIALSMALLISAGLFIRSLVNVSRVDLGLRTDHVVTFGISPELNGYTPARAKVLFERLEQELSSTPGVTGVTEALVPILAGSNWGNDVAVEGFKRDPDTDANARFNGIGPGFYRTLGIPLLAGREFTAADAAGSPKVAIVNEAFVKKFNLGRNAVGKRMAIGNREQLEIEIVGVVQNAKYSEVKQEIPPQYATPWRQDSTVGAITYYVRTSLAPEQLLRTIPGVVKQLDPNLPVENLKTLPQQVRENVFLDRMISTLSASFAVLATLLAAVGLYGVLAYTVAQRTREIGVRMALGADGSRVRGMVLGQVGKMTLIGGVIGIAAALALGRAARSLLFELQGHDPLVVALAAALLGIVAFGAGYVPALRASRVEPMQALRYE